MCTQTVSDRMNLEKKIQLKWGNSLMTSYTFGEEMNPALEQNAIILVWLGVLQALFRQGP